MEREFASLPLAAKIGVPGGKTSHENSFFSRNKFYFPTLCSKLLAELKIKLFRFSFWLQIISVFTFDFHFAARLFACNFGIFIFSQGPSSTFFQLFSKLLESRDTHPVKAKAFVAFGKPRPTTNFMWLWSNLCYCWNRTEILSVGVPNRTNTTERAQFNFTLRIFPCSMRKCAPPPASVGALCIWYPSRASAFTTTLGFMFSLIFRKRIPMFMRSPHGARHFPQHELRPFPSAELWQPLLDTVLSPTLITFNSCSGLALFKNSGRVKFFSN